MIPVRTYTSLTKGQHLLLSLPTCTPSSRDGGSEREGGWRRQEERGEKTDKKKKKVCVVSAKDVAVHVILIAPVERVRSYTPARTFVYWHTH